MLTALACAALHLHTRGSWRSRHHGASNDRQHDGRTGKNKRRAAHGLSKKRQVAAHGHLRFT